MAKVICNICGEEMDWEEELNEWCCPACLNRAFEENGEIYYEHNGTDEYDTYYDPEDMSPDKDGFDPDDL